MDQELIAYLDKRFREVNERMDSRFDQVDSRFERHIISQPSPPQQA